MIAAPSLVTVEDHPVPRPQAGELLIRTRSSLISPGTELTVVRGGEPAGTLWAAQTLPRPAGYSNVGEVVETGPGVERAWLGRRVGTYRPHAQYVVESVDEARPLVRDDVRDEEATFFILAETVLNGLRRGEVRLGEAVVVFGLGILGQLAARLCLIAGAGLVVVCDVVDHRLDLAPSDPRLVRVRADREGVRAVVAQKTGGRMADVVIELTGDPRLIPAEAGLLRELGRLVILSSPRGSGVPFNFHDLCNWPSLSIVGAHFRSQPSREAPGSPWTHRRHAELFFDLVGDGLLDVRSLITHRVPFRQAGAAYDMLLGGDPAALGVVLEW
jgi:threonine dehydrogenase-like Zn-dependent dehydrogenase